MSEERRKLKKRREAQLAQAEKNPERVPPPKAKTPSRAARSAVGKIDYNLNALRVKADEEKPSFAGYAWVWVGHLTPDEVELAISELEAAKAGILAGENPKTRLKVLKKWIDLGHDRWFSRMRHGSRKVEEERGPVGGD